MRTGSGFLGEPVTFWFRRPVCTCELVLVRTISFAVEIKAPEPTCWSLEFRNVSPLLQSRVVLKDKLWNNYRSCTKLIKSLDWDKVRTGLKPVLSLSRGDTAASRKPYPDLSLFMIRTKINVL